MPDCKSGFRAAHLRPPPPPPPLLRRSLHHPACTQKSRGRVDWLLAAGEQCTKRRKGGRGAGGKSGAPDGYQQRRMPVVIHFFILFVVISGLWGRSIAIRVAPRRRVHCDLLPGTPSALQALMTRLFLCEAPLGSREAPQRLSALHSRSRSGTRQLFPALQAFKSRQAEAGHGAKACRGLPCRCRRAGEGAVLPFVRSGRPSIHAATSYEYLA